MNKEHQPRLSWINVPLVLALLFQMGELKSMKKSEVLEWGKMDWSEFRPIAPPPIVIPISPPAITETPEPFEPSMEGIDT